MKKLSLFLLPLLFSGCYMEMVDSGEVGVQINSGVVQENPIREGFNFSMNPLADLIVYNVKAKQLEMSSQFYDDNSETISDSPVTILTKDNLQVPIDLTILYKLKDDCAPYVRREFGTDIIWDNKVVVPKARDVVRGVIGKDADVYKLNQNRESYADAIKSTLALQINEAMKRECVSVEMVSIRDIRLPQQLMDSIMKKNQMEEEARRAELEVKKAEAEARVEVAKKEGVAQAQLILAKSITPDLIKWKELEIKEAEIAKWNGAYPSTMVNGATPLLNIK